MSEHFNWPEYRKRYQMMSDEEKRLIDNRFDAWVEGNDGPEEWGTTERIIARDMFNAGWIAASIEKSILHVTTEVINREVPKEIFVVSINNYPHLGFRREEMADIYARMQNEKDAEKQRALNGQQSRVYFYHVNRVELKE